MTLDLILFILMCYIWYNVYDLVRIIFQDGPTKLSGHFEPPLIALFVFNFFLIFSSKSEMDISLPGVLILISVNLLWISPAILLALYHIWGDKLSASGKRKLDNFVLALWAIGWLPIGILFLLFYD